MNEYIVNNEFGQLLHWITQSVMVFQIVTGLVVLIWKAAEVDGSGVLPFSNTTLELVTINFGIGISVFLTSFIRYQIMNDYWFVLWPYKAKREVEKNADHTTKTTPQMSMMRRKKI